jgi:hypothetical protein
MAFSPERSVAWTDILIRQTTIYRLIQEAMLDQVWQLDGGGDHVAIRAISGFG